MTVAAGGWAGPVKLSTGEALVWEGVLFHLALLLCARQVVKRREGVSGQKRGREQWREGEWWIEREGEREGCKRNRKKMGGVWGEDLPVCPSAVSQDNIQNPLVGIMCPSVQLWQSAEKPTHCDK